MTADPGPAPGVERSFVLVRVVRGSLLLVFVVLAVVGVEARGWSSWISVALVVVGLLLLVQLARDVRRLSGPGDRPPPGRS
ncbi:hypothetical protein [Nocardioides sp.]|uniref:hypothetical protein n=1 Tax=Nocardioides sp. TaxID=35761 RepID=UPI003784B258